MLQVDALLKAAAAGPFAIAVVVIAVGLVRAASSGRAGPAELAASLALGLEFLLAAGLLRLTAIDDFGALGLVAAIVLLRKLIGTGIRFALRALGESRLRRIRA
jgi:uncharacterized membrane protein